jgi:hypothetical protein
MAVIEVVPHISVQILVNSAPVPGYANDDTAIVVTQYVEATTGANFSKQYHIKPAFQREHGIVVAANVDGKYCDGHVLEAVSHIGTSSITGTFTGIREITGAGHFLRKSVFSEV